MHRIFITGVTGFIGSNVVRYFATQNNVQLFGHSRDYKIARSKLKDLPVELIESYSVEIFNELGIDTVIHLAGIAHDLSNRYTADDYYQVNFENTKIIFNEFVTSKARKFIFLSSIKAAVDVSHQVIDEEIAPTPSSDYGKSKQRAEEFIQSVTLGGDKRVYIFRPCMVHGVGNKGNLNLLYRFAKTVLPFPFGSFRNQRSFLSIDNLNFIIQRFISIDIPSGIYHLADSGFLSTAELYELIARELNKRPMVWHIPSRFIRFLFLIVGKSSMLSKLTEDMMVSNKKLLYHVGGKLPVDIREGLTKTIRSFQNV